MDTDLIGLPTNILLKKFGAGDHKPGSGSAAALQGLLAADLIKTVISLTTDAKRRSNYIEVIPSLNKILSEIDDRIYKDLQKLFQSDSEQFEKTISARKARDKEQSDYERKRELSLLALKELELATELPIRIANLCIELAESALFVFKHGFKSARGDSGVAINSSLSAVGGCLSIIDLNLLSFKKTDWTDKIRVEVGIIRKRYHELSKEASTISGELEREVEQKQKFYSDLYAFLNNIQPEENLSYIEIEHTASKLQNIIWKYRESIWKRKPPKTPIESIDAKLAFELLGYQFQAYESLGAHEVQGEYYEIAGQIDKLNKTVAISGEFPLQTRNFTAAHELGHALFHKQNILHRDRPIDGSSNFESRSLQEKQADKFAACFLMPGKQVKLVFEELFSQKKLIFNEELAFALNEKNLNSLRLKCRNLREFSRLIASTEFFNNNPFSSLSKHFHVTDGAMAIRLEELKLVEY